MEALHTFYHYSELWFNGLVSMKVLVAKKNTQALGEYEMSEMT